MMKIYENKSFILPFSYPFIRTNNSRASTLRKLAILKGSEASGIKKASKNIVSDLNCCCGIELLSVYLYQ
jgi:hypothetical protein